MAPLVVRLGVVGLFTLICAARSTGAVVRVEADLVPAPAAFAADEVRRALEQRDATDASARPSEEVPAVIFTFRDSQPVTEAIARGLLRPPGELGAEGFSLRRAQDGTGTLWVIAPDAGGLLYGGLELAEQVRLYGREAVTELDRTPRFARRGVKFNLPLDVRTPSYSDASDAAQQNLATVWDLSFWQDYIDRLARLRYNTISLWNLHPFPSLVRVPEYPDIALADVQRSTGTWNEHHSLQATDLDTPEILGSVETVKRLTIDEKIAFWREVMRYGKSRNVDFYLITWNLFLNGTGGKYGLTDSFEDPRTTDYFRRSVRELVLTYPDLAGVGLTTGENLRGASFEEKEDWAFRTYGQGVLDALAVQPERRILFIHRQHQAGAKEIARTFAPLIAHPGVEFVFSFKYAEAHALSSTVQPFHRGFVDDIAPTKTLWTLRNDDNYLFRWGGAGFVRDFMRNLPADPSRGFYYGSDQYVWGREFLDAEPGAPARLEIDKHWYHWLLWGRLGYDPELPDARLVDLLRERFPGADAKRLFDAWQAASRIHPLTTGFHWARFDFQWYPEASQSRSEPAQTPTGFHDINRFISLPPHPGSGNLSIPDYVKAVVAGEEPSGTTPLEVSAALHEAADQALAGVAGLPAGGDRELRRTLEDIRCLAYLGKYYAHKIRAATALARFRVTLERGEQEAVATELNQAAHWWRRYAAVAHALYRLPLWTNRVGHVDLRRTFDDVVHDLRTTGSEIRIPSLAPTPGGVILEAESARTNDTPARTGDQARRAGFTGAGYLDFNGSEGRRWVEWTYDAPAAGVYMLEFRYTMRHGDRLESELAVNDEPWRGTLLWLTPDEQTWVWDRKLVRLNAGPNTIRLRPGGFPLVDHLNVLPWWEEPAEVR